MDIYWTGLKDNLPEAINKICWKIYIFKEQNPNTTISNIQNIPLKQHSRQKTQFSK